MMAAEEFVDLTTWEPAEDEPAGENEKTWFLAPDETRWIFKRNREKRSPNENSSELVASKVARLMGIPAAEVRLAKNGQDVGCISRDVKSDSKNQLDAGSMFIAELAENFDPKARDAAGHSLHNILRVLEGAAPPIGHEHKGMAAAGWFAGFLVFDALIGNQDRHSENWSLEADVQGQFHLAPSYDHATSLGIVQRNSETLSRMLGDPPQLQRFVQRARGSRFEGQAKTNLVDVAAAFCHAADPSAALHWEKGLSVST